MRTNAVALLTVALLASCSAVAGAEPSHSPSAPTSTVNQSTENLGSEVTKDGNVTTIRSEHGVATLTVNPDDGSVTFVNVHGDVQTFDRKSLLNPTPPGAVEVDRPGDIQPQGIVTDWRAYLCNAAVAAATGTNGAAWRAALAVAQPFRFIPVVNAALIVGHAGAAVFLSTQC